MKRYLTTGEAAALCGVTKDTMLKWVKAGKITSTRTQGGHYRILRRDLLELVTPDAQPLDQESSKPFMYCWEFHSKSDEIDPECPGCIVYRTQAYLCYEMRLIPDNAGHLKTFCKSTCVECDYYRYISGTPPNILVLTKQRELQKVIKAMPEDPIENVFFSDDEYQCSRLIDKYRPDFIIIDSEIGTQRVQSYIRNLSADSRIPLAHLVLCGNKKQLHADNGFDNELFSRLHQSLSEENLLKLINTIRRHLDLSSIIE